MPVKVNRQFAYKRKVSSRLKRRDLGPKSNSQFYPFLKGSKPFAAENDPVFLCKNSPHYSLLGIPVWLRNALHLHLQMHRRPSIFIESFFLENAATASADQNLEKAKLCPILVPTSFINICINIIYILFISYLFFINIFVYYILIFISFISFILLFWSYSIWPQINPSKTEF